MIRVAAGDKVTPAHSHPNGEEVIYIIQGSGVLVGSEVQQVRAGMAVLFPQGVVHMLHNTGSEEMKVVCFFAADRPRELPDARGRRLPGLKTIAVSSNLQLPTPKSRCSKRLIWSWKWGVGS